MIGGDRQPHRAAPIRLVDSAPIALMTYTRGARCTSVVGREDLGVVTSKKGKVLGVRLPATVTVDQWVDDWCVAPPPISIPKSWRS